MYITVKDIFAKVTEVEIFEKYSDVEVSVGRKFCSPLRVDKRPTCSFTTDKAGRLILKDFSGHFHGDCFQFVMTKFNVSFYEAIRIVAKDFGIIPEDSVSTPQPIKSSIKEDIKKQRETTYSFTVNKWNDKNVHYWKDRFRVDKQLLNFFQIRPLKSVWRGDEIVYRWRDSDPGFVYYFGKDDFKLYFPLRTTNKFISQAKSIQGFNQLPDKGNILIITKSMKDVVVFGMLGLPAIAPQSESTYIDDKTMKRLIKRFKHIVVVYDFDLTGVSYSNKIRRKYEKRVTQFFFTNGRLGSADYGEKDISDLLEGKKGSAKDQVIRRLHSSLYGLSRSISRRQRPKDFRKKNRDIKEVLESLFVPSLGWG
jgi:hypothetical protein